MSKTHRKPATEENQAVLVDQQYALYAYLDELLQEIPDTEEPAAAVAQAQAPTVEMPTTDTAPEAPAAGATAEAAPRPDLPPHCPAWASHEFQSLMFRVTGLNLAVPLDKLNGVIPWQPDAITPMPGHSAAFLGLLPHLEQNVKVIDLAQVVLPAERRAGLAPASERIGHILLIDEGRWGLACDSIGEVMTLQPADVRWRSPEGKRPWLAGTLIEQLSALLELDALTRLLETGKE